MIPTITKAYIRHSSDNGQTSAYVEWTDTQGENGRTEGAYLPGAHMKALLDRAKREGVTVARETW
jgi:LDH2 family malate/lactate/ureidoglycolate dehydrogenase